MRVSRITRSAPCRRVRLGDLTPDVERRANGTLLVRARAPLGAHPRTITDRLAEWAAVAPERALLAWRSGPAFARLSYGDAITAIDSVAQALLDRRLSAERPLAILSGNSAEHLMLALASQHAGIAYAPVSPAYSLLSTDFGALRHVMGLLTPGLVFADDGAKFSRAIAAAIPAGVERDPCGTITSVRVSAVTGAGLGELRAALAERFPASPAPVTETLAAPDHSG